MDGRTDRHTHGRGATLNAAPIEGVTITVVGSIVQVNSEYPHVSNDCHEVKYISS